MGIMTERAYHEECAHGMLSPLDIIYAYRGHREGHVRFVMRRQEVCAACGKSIVWHEFRFVADAAIASRGTRRIQLRHRVFNVPSVDIG